MQPAPETHREHDVSTLTTDELIIAHRQLTASLGLSRPDSPINAPTMAQLHAIDDELQIRKFKEQRAALLGRLPVDSDSWRG